MDTGEILNKLKVAVPGSMLEKSRFGRSAHLSLWVETRTLPEVAAFLKNDEDLQLDWLENLSAIQMEKAIVLTYFLRSYTSANTLILRVTVVPPSASKEVELASVVPSWPMAAPFEAEIREMFGVCFMDTSGKPAYALPFRLPQGWNGFPLRKSYVFPSEILGIPHVSKPMAPEGHA